MRGVRGAILALAGLLAACTGKPEGIEPVRGFDPQRYLGTWYEIARLPHGFEEGLSRVRAEYSPREDGGLEVLNIGYNAASGEWERAEGKAYFVEDRDTGYLKVSFFGPFYGAYVVFRLDPGYQWSMVTGNDRSYLWLLARDPRVGQGLIDDFTATAAELGFPVEDLIFVDQSPVD